VNKETVSNWQTVQSLLGCYYWSSVRNKNVIRPVGGGGVGDGVVVVVVSTG
jgi:hypothetical protein